MKPREIEDPAALITYFHSRVYYDNGILRHKVSTDRVTKDNPAGNINVKTGYIQISFNGISYPAHRVIFAMHHGYFPGQVDHINRIKHDNRIENLRESDNSLNSYNSKVRSDNASGVTGVQYRQDNGKWRARIVVNGVRKNLGEYATLEDAAVVRRNAELFYYGEVVPETNKLIAHL
jgi:hypothetical protein